MQYLLRDYQAMLECSSSSRRFSILGVAMGAFGAHGLRGAIVPDMSPSLNRRPIPEYHVSVCWRGLDNRRDRAGAVARRGRWASSAEFDLFRSLYRWPHRHDAFGAITPIEVSDF